MDLADALATLTKSELEQVEVTLAGVGVIRPFRYNERDPEFTTDENGVLAI